MEVPQLTVRFTVENINKTNLFTSQSFNVRGLQWKIKVIKSKESLSVYLESLIKDESTDWSCMAWCKVELIAWCRQNYEKSFKSPREFSARHLSNGFKNFISLKKLFDPANSYIENDSIALQIKVKANVPINLSKTVVDIRSCIRLQIDDIDASCGFLSPVFYICGVPWRVKVYKRKICEEKAIAVMLNCVLNDSNDWSCKASAIFRLKSYDPGQPSHQWRFSKLHKFTQKFPSHGCRSFITWGELLDVNKEFVRNRSIVFDIELTVEKPTGIAAKKTSDCPICMENLLELPVRAIGCGHVFCKPCIEKVVSTKNNCPTCKASLIPSQIKTIYLP